MKAVQAVEIIKGRMGSFGFGKAPFEAVALGKCHHHHGAKLPLRGAWDNHRQTTSDQNSLKYKTQVNNCEMLSEHSLKDQ